MDNTLDIINKILERRLHQSDVVSILNSLNEQEREEFLVKVTDMLAKLTALLDVTKKISEILELNLLLGRIMEITTEAIDADRGSLFLNDHETDELFSRVVQGESISEIRLSNQSGIAGSVFATGKPIIINDAYSDKRFNKEVDKMAGYITKNILCAPIRTRNNEIIGIIQLLNKKEGDFNDDDLSLLEAITTQASAALQNAQLYDRMQKAEKDESQLLEIAASISSELQLKPLLAKIMETNSRYAQC
jgi:adenylate cyclase